MAGEGRRYQNFDAIRLAAASAVVFSHSFALSRGGYFSEPFVRLLGWKNELGLYAVGAFFVISGFLITASYLGRASIGSYVVNRVMRIFPGLIACAFVTAFLIGPWFADSLRAYLTSDKLWSYLWHTSAMRSGGGFGLPVPWYQGDYGDWIIGTFWTLPAEFTAYIGVLILGRLGLLRLPVALVMLAVGVWAHSNWPYSYLGGTAWTLMFFAAGSALYFIHQRARPGQRVVIAAGVAYAISIVAGYPLEGSAIFGSILLIQLATTSAVRLPDAARFGDLSYGVYLYGWPMQQVVRAAWGPSIAWWQMFAIAMPLTLLCARASWHLIEQRALGLARRFRRRSVSREAADAGPRPVQATA